VIRVGIAGFGIVGRRRKECVDRHSGMQLVAVCDRLFEKEGQYEDGVKFFNDYARVLESNLNALIVCVPNDLAPKITDQALRKGLHVFCEKPPGQSAENVRTTRLIEEKHPDLKLMYGFNHRYHHSVQEALEIVRSGRLGKLINLRGVYGKSKLVTFNQSDWRIKREIAGGGVLLDQGIHMVDLMRLFAGEFKEVHSFISNSFWGYDVEDNAYALMRTEDGVVAMLNSSATQWRHQFRLDISLEKGSLILGGILSGSKSYGAETLTVIDADVESDFGDPKEVVTRYNHDPSWDFEIREFASCIAEDCPVSKSSSQDALRTMELVDRIYSSDPSWNEKWTTL
jgi:predicted dehydrogenase